MTDWGRETCGDLAAAESREWLCTNGLGGFASGTIAGLLSRRYHGLLVAALQPPLGRTLVVAKVDETLIDDGGAWSLFTNRWADGSIDPHGYRHIERFRLDGTIPTWTYACGDVLVEKRVWMEHGANTTYVRYAVLRASRPLTLELRALVNYRDYHALTRSDGWRMRVAPLTGGLRVDAFEGATPMFLLAAAAEASVAHTWHEHFQLAREGERGLDDREDHLHAGTFRASLKAGRPLTLVLSTEANAAIDGEQALARRRRHDASVVATWHAATPTAATESSRAAAAPNRTEVMPGVESDDDGRGQLEISLCRVSSSGGAARAHYTDLPATGGHAREPFTAGERLRCRTKERVS